MLKYSSAVSQSVLLNLRKQTLPAWGHAGSRAEYSSGSMKYVPVHEPAIESDLRRLEKFLDDKPHILVLTGAGISTESGG